MPTPDSLPNLHTAVADLRATVQSRLAPLELAALQQRPGSGRWSVLECLEHLNRYSRYYNPALASALARADAAATSPAAPAYSWLGRKSVEMMRPGNAKKQTTPKHLNPLGTPLDQKVLPEFDQHQARLLELLHQAPAAHLNRKAVPVEFFRLLKLRVGEALEFVVMHQQRHVQQALLAAGLE